MTEEPIALDAYGRLAEAYAAQVDVKAHNAFYERPAMLSLMPKVEGKRVLDVGCGPGTYAQWLTAQGAEVVGIDASPKMVALAQRRLQGKADIFQADFGQPLRFLETGSFEVVLSTLALDYVRNWHRLFKDFFRLLRDPGYFLFSVAHPLDEFFCHHPEGNYFHTEAVVTPFNWPAFDLRVQVPSYRRPLRAMIAPLVEAGFILERLLEPQPTPEFREQDPIDYAKLMRQPGFICFRGRKGWSA